MRQGSSVELKMKKTLRMEDQLCEKVFPCEIFSYDEKKERIYLLIENEDLTEISLDAVYECGIYVEAEKIWCDGRIKERYRNESGNVLEFQIENGFYKISIKSVDKQES